MDAVLDDLEGDEYNRYYGYSGYDEAHPKSPPLKAMTLKELYEFYGRNYSTRFKEVKHKPWSPYIRMEGDE